MTIPVKVKTKYEKMGNVAVQVLQITALEDINIKSGSILTLRSGATDQIQIRDIEKYPHPAVYPQG